MDLWIALAAAGAGYVAKNWKSPHREGENSSEFSFGDPKSVKCESPTFNGHIVDKSGPFRRFAQRKRLAEDDSTLIASKAEVASTGECEDAKLGNPDNYEDCNVLCASNLSSGYLKNEPIHGENFGGLYIEPSISEICSPYDLKKSRSSLRSRRSNLRMIKPLTSLESCLMAQLCKEHAGMEEYVLNCVPPPSSPTVRPFFVTDGRRVISRSGADSQGEAGKNKLHNEISLAEETVFGVPPLPYNASLEVPRRKVKIEKGMGGKLSSSMVNGKHPNSIAGSSNGALLFGLGVSVGLISSLLANKREVGNLSNLLKQRENLIQDLQDELEMKDSLVVKEMALEDLESQGTYHCSYNKSAPHSFSSEQNLDGSTKSGGKKLPDQRAEEDSESMSKIEAELEAELERLELNMNSSSLEGRLPDLLELDPDFIPGVSQGELRADMFGKQPYADQDGSGSSTSYPANYSVSPRELSLRLHEVIQERLEERVKELETAIKISDRKIQFMESENKMVPMDSDDDESRSSPYLRRPTAIAERNGIDRPVIINLSGEALDAYNVAYDELMRANGSDKVDLIASGEENHDQNGEVNLSYEDYVITSGSLLPGPFHHEAITSDDHILHGDGFSGTENDSDDELGKLLIKQIVEKTRRNSSVILNVKRELFEDKYEQ